MRLFLRAFHLPVFVPTGSLLGLLLRERNSHLYVSKSRRRRPMSGAHRLHRVAFAAIWRAPERPMLARANRIPTIPELSGNAAVARILDHAAFFAALDLPSNFGGKLEMITPVVDGPRSIRLHQNRIIGIG